MAKWVSHGRYPGIFRDAEDPTHWRVVVNLGRAGKGEPRRRAVRVLHGTLADAREARTTLQGQRDKRTLRPQPERTPKTVGAWALHWVDTYTPGVSRATRDRYRRDVKTYIIPDEISGRHLRRLTSDDLQGFHNRLRGRGLAPGTIFQVFAGLRRILKTATVAGVIGANPMLELQDPPKRPGRRKLRVPSDDELAGLLELMRGSASPAYPITRMALATGLREGELIALEWPSVDLKAGTVWVCRSASRVQAGPEGRHYYEYEFKSTKTDDSTASVPLDPETVAWLREWKKTVRSAKVALRPHRWTDGDGDLVFPCLAVFAGSPAGRAWQQGSLRVAFGRSTGKVGLGYLRFHDLRHIYGAVLHRKGTPLLTISRLMRHASIKTTADIYGHVSDEERRAAVGRLSDVFNARGRSTT